MNSFVDVSQVDVERDEALNFVDDLESNEMSASDFDDVERSWNTEDVLGSQESTGTLECTGNSGSAFEVVEMAWKMEIFVLAKHCCC